MGRRLASTLALLLCSMTASTASAAPDIGFSRIRQEFRTEDSFKRISEFFSGSENTGNQIVFRTREDERDGFYFSFRLRSDRGETLPAGTIVLHLYRPGAFEPTLYTFPLEVRDRRSIEVLVGLTGGDWPDPGARPVAWKLEFLDATTGSLGSEESFLWEMPDEETE